MSKNGGKCLDKETRAQKQTLSGECLSSHFDVCETDAAQSRSVITAKDNGFLPTVQQTEQNFMNASS